jgi:hypothetical protein
MLGRNTFGDPLLFLSVSFLTIVATGNSLFPPQALAEPTQLATQLPASMKISAKALEKYTSITVEAEEKGNKVKFTGIPLRALLTDLVPGLKIDEMAEWKALSRKELVIEVMGDDGYPGLVTATSIAMNTSGDRYILATQRDGKPIEAGVQLICRLDEARVRWVRQVVSLRVVSLAENRK